MPEESNKLDEEIPQLSDTAMAHLYRGELGRSDRWRTRLDTTTNWALTVTAATISFSFGSAQTSHVTLLVGIWMVVTFLLVEARRYRYYDLWNRRVRLIEDGYWSPLLRREPLDPDALRELAVELSRPHLQLSFFSALSVRMNRAYGSLLFVLLATWFVKVFSHPTRAKTFSEFLDRAHVGPVPGGGVLAVVAAFTAVFLTAYIVSLVARAPLGELQSRPRRSRLAVSDMLFRPYAIQPPRRRTPKTSQKHTEH
ncbi:MAG: DUF2270 domain-containing protein [Myxococcaceae bacterium]